MLVILLLLLLVNIFNLCLCDVDDGDVYFERMNFNNDQDWKLELLQDLDSKYKSRASPSSRSLQEEKLMDDDDDDDIESVEGFYKGSSDDGNCLLIIDELNENINIDIDELNENINSNLNKSIYIASKPSYSRLIFLNSSYKRYRYSFWNGIYDKNNKLILLSTYNFSYNLLLHNISFIGYNESLNECPGLLLIKMNDINNNNINGNFTDCRHNISLYNLSFVTHSIFVHSANTYSIFSLCFVSITFYFLFKQYEYSNMMGRIIKISFITLYLQFIYNGTICFLHFDVAMNVNSLFTSFLVIAFICIMNANLYQRMMAMIWSLRYPIYDTNNIKLFNFTKILSFIIILFISNYIIIGKYSYLIFFILLSDWSFQIIHNIKTGHIMSWRLSSIIFNTICKLFYPLYIYGCPKNIIQNDTNYLFCFIIIIWSIIQIVILYSQDLQLNSRWFIPENMKPIHYKYHKTPNYNIDDDDIDTDDDDDDDDDDNISENDIESIENDNNNRNIINNNNNNNNNNDRKQCSICLENINWKKEYQTIMITPCNHYFHDQCLTTWMQQRLTCPTCRTQLPPAS